MTHGTGCERRTKRSSREARTGKLTRTAAGKCRLAAGRAPNQRLLRGCCFLLHACSGGFGQLALGLLEGHVAGISFGPLDVLDDCLVPLASGVVLSSGNGDAYAAEDDYDKRGDHTLAEQSHVATMAPGRVAGNGACLLAAARAGSAALSSWHGGCSQDARSRCPPCRSPRQVPPLAGGRRRDHDLGSGRHSRRNGRGCGAGARRRDAMDGGPGVRPASRPLARGTGGNVPGRARTVGKCW
jgi:hypothetical protein